jgi:hypothetical protein
MENTAARFEARKQVRANREALQLRETAIKDDRFKQLYKELRQLIQDKADKLNADGRVGNILTVVADPDEIRISRKDGLTEVLGVKFKPLAHIVRFTFDGGLKFDETIGIFVQNMSPFLTRRQGRGDEENLPDANLPWFVDRVFAALLYDV